MATLFLKLQRAIEKIAKALAWIASALLGYMLFIVPLDGIGRYFFNHPLTGTLEISESIIVMIIFLAAAYCEFTQGHIRVTFLFDKFSEKPKFAIRIVTSVLSIVYFFILSWQSGLIALHALKINEISSGSIPIPLWIPKFSVTIGSIAMVMLIIVKVINLLLHNHDVEDEAKEVEPLSDTMLIS